MIHPVAGAAPHTASMIVHWHEVIYPGIILGCIQVLGAAAADAVCDGAGGARRGADEQALHRAVPPRLPHRPPAYQAPGACPVPCLLITQRLKHVVPLSLIGGDI